MRVIAIYPCDIPVWEHPLLGQLEHLPWASFQRKKTTTKNRQIRRPYLANMINILPTQVRFAQMQKSLSSAKLFIQKHRVPVPVQRNNNFSELVYSINVTNYSVYVYTL